MSTQEHTFEFIDFPDEAFKQQDLDIVGPYREYELK